MKAFLDKLPENQFLRIHKSFIINLNKVIDYTSSVVNVEGVELPISRYIKKIFVKQSVKFNMDQHQNLLERF
jgi:DNA-binding LytR/AlgR family response regulator